jgi:hypothetical protein
MLSFSAAAYSQVFISVRIGPPALPVYAQPICPGPGYLWTPGYWAWDDDDGYYWVPGTWVVAPIGLFWTPGYWGWNEGFYVFHAGYWGPHVGFYGGINYGFGYTGVGFVGGEWRGREFFYNRSVTNVNVVNVTNVYNKTVIVHNETRVSYNGGTGGVGARPTREEARAEHEHHQAPLAVQTEHQHAASQNRELFARVNQGRPAVAATVKPADFHSAVPAKAAGAVYHAPAMTPREARAPASAGNRPSGAANEKGNGKKSNEGFRPFTPPAKGNSGGNERSTNAKNNKPENTSRPSENRPNASRPSESRPNTSRSNESRPTENRSNTSRPSESRPSENRPPSHSSSAPRENASRPQTESRPQHESRLAPQHESRPAPQHESRPAPQHESRPAPAHEAAPKPAAQPRHESAPPQHKEAAPKPEKEHKPGRGR